MEARHLGRTGLRVSRIGLGTLTWARDTGERDAADQLKTFWEAGGTLVDTADVYADGGAEYLLGRLLEGLVPRRDLVVATKAGSVPDPDRRFDCSRGHLLAALDASLERLGTDYVDLWQVHAFDPATPLEETLQALDIAVEHRPGALRRDLQLLRLAARQGRHLAARRAGHAHQAGQHADGVLAAPARRRTRAAARRAGPRPRAAALLAAGPRRAHRQVPRRRRRRPTRVARRSSWRAFVAPYLDETAGPDRGRGVDSGRRTGRAHRCRWRWRGCATGRASWRRSSARARRSSSRRRCQWRALAFLTRSAERSTMCRRRCTAIPTRTGASCDATTRQPNSSRPYGRWRAVSAPPRPSSTSRARSARARPTRPPAPAARPAPVPARAAGRGPVPVPDELRGAAGRGRRAGGAGRAGRGGARRAGRRSCCAPTRGSCSRSRAYGPSRPTASPALCSAPSAARRTSGAPRRWSVWLLERAALAGHTALEPAALAKGLSQHAVPEPDEAVPYGRRRGGGARLRGRPGRRARERARPRGAGQRRRPRRTSARSGCCWGWTVTRWRRRAWRTGWPG